MGIKTLIVIWPLREKTAADFISPWVTNPDVRKMRRCRWLGFIHTKLWIIKRKKEPKKEKGNNSSIFKLIDKCKSKGRSGEKFIECQRSSKP